MGNERRNGIPRAAATRGNDRMNTRSRGLSFSRVWLPRAKNPGLSSELRPGGEKIDTPLSVGDADLNGGMRRSLDH
jgi:hypothetical protein